MKEPDDIETLSGSRFWFELSLESGGEFSLESLQGSKSTIVLVDKSDRN